jgi:hypothetical protein
MNYNEAADRSELYISFDVFIAVVGQFVTSCSLVGGYRCFSGSCFNPEDGSSIFL